MDPCDADNLDGCDACAAPPAKAARRCCGLCYANGAQCKRRAGYPRPAASTQFPLVYCKMHYEGREGHAEWNDGCNPANIEQYRAVCKAHILSKPWIRRAVNALPVNEPLTRAEAYARLKARFNDIRRDSRLQRSDFVNILRTARTCVQLKRSYQVRCVASDTCGWPNHEQFTFKMGHFVRGLSSWLAQDWPLPPVETKDEETAESREQKQQDEDDQTLDVLVRQRKSKAERRQQARHDLHVMSKKLVEQTLQGKLEGHEAIWQFARTAAEQKLPTGMRYDIVVLVQDKSLSQKQIQAGTWLELTEQADTLRKEGAFHLRRKVLGDTMQDALAAGWPLPVVVGAVFHQAKLSTDDMAWVGQLWITINAWIQYRNALAAVRGPPPHVIPERKVEPVTLNGWRIKIACAADQCKAKGTKRCKQCRARLYCSAACQKRDWPRHKSQCQYFQQRMQSVRRS